MRTDSRLLQEFRQFQRARNPRSVASGSTTADLLEYLKRRRVDFARYTEVQWGELADEAGLEGQARNDFLEEVASWL